MAKQDAGTELQQDEFSRIFDEYRAKIEEITRRTEKNLNSLDETPQDKVAQKIERIQVLARSPLPEMPGHDGNQEKAASAPPAEPAGEPEPVNSEMLIRIINTPAPSPEPVQKPEPNINVSQIKAPALPPPQPAPEQKNETVNTRNEGRRVGFEGYSEIIQDAKREAKKIIEEAEESAKKEARKRTQSQIDKIIEKAKKESEETIERANRDAEKVRDDVIAESKREADFIIRDITQKYRQETEALSSHAMTEAQEKAQRMLADISASTAQVGQHLTEIVTRARKTIDELETSLQAEAMELSRIITETQSKLEEVGKTVRIERSVPPPVVRQTAAPGVNPTLAVRLIGEKSAGNNGTGVLFSGQMEMKSVSAEFDYQYLKKLKKYLVHIANIKYLQEYASEKEMSVLFDILEPLPLFDILSNIPMVDEVITRADDDICLVFKNSE
ncbi:MAG: ATP synthase F0 subunit B [Dehalococcoidales bacterium]